MDILKALVPEGIEHNIGTVDTEDGLVFSAADLGKVLGMSDIAAIIADFDDDEKHVKTIDAGDEIREDVFLTEDGVFQLLMSSGQPNAKFFQKWVSNVIKSVNDTGSYELASRDDNPEGRLQSVLRQGTAEQKDIAAQARHTALLSVFGHRKSVVYFGRFNHDGISDLIKIGCTQDLRESMSGLKKTFVDFKISEVFECSRYRQFKTFLTKLREILPFRFDGEINGHISNEVFRMSEDELIPIIQIAKENHLKFRDSVSVETEIARRNVSLEERRSDIARRELALAEARMENARREMAEIERASTPVFEDERRYTQARGPKIQRYSEDGRELIRTYAGHTEASRDVTLDRPIPPLIRNHAHARTVYKGFRWAELDRDLPDDTIQDIGETVESKTVRKGMVAMIDIDKTRIMQVFCDKKEASSKRKVTPSAITKACQLQTMSSGHFWQMWHDCDEKFRTEYHENGGVLPAAREQNTHQKIHRVDPISGSHLVTFESVADCIKEMKFSRHTLKEAIETERILKGSRWKYAPISNESDA